MGKRKVKMDSRNGMEKEGLTFKIQGIKLFVLISGLSIRKNICLIKHCNLFFTNVEKRELKVLKRFTKVGKFLFQTA